MDREERARDKFQGGYANSRIWHLAPTTRSRMLRGGTLVADTIGPR